MSDIVERLREDIVEWEGHYSDEMIPRYYPPPPLQLEAADTIERLRAEVEALRAFAQDVMSAWPLGDVDGDDLQESAIKRGLLAPMTRTGPCGESCGCAEYYAADEWADGITCYRRTALLNGAARSKP